VVSLEGTGHRTIFVGHVYKCAVYDIKEHIITKFSSQRLNYIHRKFYRGQLGTRPLTGVAACPLSLPFEPLLGISYISTPFR